MIRSEDSPQSCSNVQIAESGSHYEEEVSIYSLHDPFADYLEPVSSTDVNLFLSNEGWFCCPFELHISITWVPAFIVSRSRVSSVNQILVWLHRKHVFT